MENNSNEVLPAVTWIIGFQLGIYAEQENIAAEQFELTKR